MEIADATLSCCHQHKESKGNYRYLVLPGVEKYFDTGGF
jgi:hypothetical protein